MSVPPDKPTRPVAIAGPRPEFRRVVDHLAHRVRLLNQPDQRQTQMAIIAGALIQVSETGPGMQDETLDRLLGQARSAVEVRRLTEPLLSTFVTRDEGAFDEFVSLLTAELMLERSSFGSGAARRIRYQAGSSATSAAARLASMLGEADRLRRPAGTPGPPGTPAQAGTSGQAGAENEERAGGGDFWNALSPPDRQAFMTLSHERTFAVGAHLMREGEAADYVIVILSGWTKVCVDDGGTQRDLAVRGPGQLLGERGVLHGSVRSATVVALETVRALVMKTEDFTSFMDAHPAVLGIVEEQAYQRLAEDPAYYVRDRLPSVPDAGSVAGPPSAALPSARPAGYPPPNGENCTIVLTDVVAFGARNRNDEDRRIIRKAVLEMTYSALSQVWDDCSTEDRGDGLLIVAPPGIPTTRVIEQLLAALPGALRRHNRTYGPFVRIQLRVAIDMGLVRTDDLGMSGEAIIQTARLLEASALKKAVAGKNANLGLIVSPVVYQTAIRQLGSTIDPATYRRVRVNVKGNTRPAWMQVPA